MSKSNFRWLLLAIAITLICSIYEIQLARQNRIIIEAVCTRFLRDEKTLADALPKHARRLLAKSDCPTAMREAERKHR